MAAEDGDHEYENEFFLITTLETWALIAKGIVYKRDRERDRDMF